MLITRRATLGLAGGALVRVNAAEGVQPWTPAWDRALIRAAVARADQAFDTAENMIRRRVDGAYRYHTNTRDMDVHPTRDSLEYALFLFEAGQTERAAAVLNRVIALQDTDTTSKWYGLWSYYLEEPLPKMAPADWNWADFNGSYLLLIEFRHGGKIPRPLRARVREAIRHAAASVRRRNVSMTYTNIAVQGTFVTLAAAELLEDADLLRYATERLRRFAGTVDLTGSFAEYNSPTYAAVTINNLTRMRTYVKNADSRALADKLHERAWLHLGSHWHPPTQQLAGPMSRSYSTDIGRPLWIQKALNNKVRWTSFNELASTARSGDGEVATLDLRVPPSVVPRFLELKGATQHREIFGPGDDRVRPVQGTTFLHPEFSIGSVNRGDFWVQRRPLVAYWSRPAQWAQLRVIKDDYDLASALLYATQSGPFILGQIAFRWPGGDKHVSLDPLPAEFAASRLYVKLQLSGKPAATRQDGAGAIYQLGPGLKLEFRIREARFRDYEGRFTVENDGPTFDFLPPGGGTVHLAEAGEAFAVFTIAIGEQTGGAYDAATCSWTTPHGTLSLGASRRVAPIAEQDRALKESVDGEPVPLVRLSDERLV